MIDQEIKDKIILELEKLGNVYFACIKNNISRNSYYRWFSSDPIFKKSALKAIKLGRQNICDIAEHALVSKFKEKNIEAIKYALSHNSPHYRSSKTTKVIIEHRRSKIEIPKEVRTLEDIINEAEKENEAKIDHLSIPADNITKAIIEQAIKDEEDDLT